MSDRLTCLFALLAMVILEFATRKGDSKAVAPALSDLQEVKRFSFQKRF